MKTCKGCGIAKNLSEYHYHKTNKDRRRGKCKACISVKSKERYKKVGHIIRQQMADQRKRDYEHRLEIERRSRAKNKERQRPLKNARQQIRNRFLSGAKHTITRKDMARIYNGSCFNCGTTDNLSADHIIPISRGGNHSIGNLMTLCRSCNASKRDLLLVEWKHKKLLTQEVPKSHITHS